MNKIIQWLAGGEVGSDWSFGFISEYDPYVKFALFAAFAAMAYLVIRSYLREGQTKRSAKLWLAAIRIVVILAAFMVLFRPAIVNRITRTMYSTVVMLTDDSLSMSFKDNYSDPKETQAIADTFQITPADIESTSRHDLLGKALTRPGNPVDKLLEDHPVELLQFATNGDHYTVRVGPPIADGIIEDRKAGRKTPTSAPANFAARWGELKTVGHETNIALALRDAVDSLQGRHGAIVLLSDGRMTDEKAELRLAQARDYAAKNGVPIYTVAVGDPVPPKNIAVTSLQAPREVRNKSDALFTAKVSHRGLVGQTVGVKLQRRLEKAKDTDPWTDVATKTVTLANDSDEEKNPTKPVVNDPAKSRGESEVEFPVAVNEPREPDKEYPPEDYVYRATVEALPGEQNKNDNSAEASVKIVDRPIRVLLVSGDAGAEFQFLKSYLLSQPELFRISVWQENADKDVSQAASSGMKLETFPNSLEALIKSADGKFPGYDVVILYDPQPTDKGFDKNFVENLKAAVSVHRMGLCYIAGNKYSARDLGTNFEAYDALRDLLPVTIDSRMPFELAPDKKPDPWSVIVTDYGLDHPIMRLASTADGSQKIWDAMPGIYWAHSLKNIKPAARVLLENGNPARRLDRQSEPLIVVQPVGRGRVMYMNFDETWRWRSVEDQKYYRMFWSNVVQYLCSSSGRQVLITTGGDRFTAGEKIKVEAEAYTPDYKPLTDAKFKLRLINKVTGKQDIIELDKSKLAGSPDKFQDGRYEGTIPAGLTAQVGTYVLTSTLEDPTATEAKEIKIELPQAEAIRPESDPGILESLATKPNYALKLQDVDKLTSLIPVGRRDSVRADNHEIWDRTFTLIFIVTLLTIEWILRKKYNMA